MKYTLPDTKQERDRILFTLKTQGHPAGDLVEYACKHHLDLSLLRNVVQPTAPALTIKQPWAWAIVSGLKDVENRTWATPHRGALLIHAAKKPDPMGFEFLSLMGIQPPDTLDYGGIIGAADVVDCVSGYLSDWAMPGQWHWVLKGARSLPFQPMRGQLGLWRAG